MSFVLSATVYERFWQKVAVCRHGRRCTTCCWLWTAGKKNNGYGQFFIGRDGNKVKMVHAHRFAYELLRGQLFANIALCHNCPTGDNRLCCNPAHLFPGTQGDNLQDASKKGRLHRKRNPETVLRGEAVGNSKLTAEDVRTIRTLAAEGMKIAAIARQFPVHPTTVGEIVYRHHWKHID